MKLSKIVFKGAVDGIFGESVSSLMTTENPTIRSVASLEVTLFGLVVTKVGVNGEPGTRHLVPLHACGTGDLVDEQPVAMPAGLQTQRQLGELGLQQQGGLQEQGQTLGLAHEGNLQQAKPRSPKAKAR